MGRAGLEGQPGIKEADSVPSLDWPHPFRSLEACLTPRACCVLPGNPGDEVADAARPAKLTIRWPRTLSLPWGRVRKSGSQDRTKAYSPTQLLSQGGEMVLTYCFPPFLSENKSSLQS